MEYKNFMSKTEDVMWLAHKLKDELGGKISINKVGLYKEVLEGKYKLKGYGKVINFSILYSDREFLRVEVGEIGAYASSYEDKVFVLNELKNAISNIVRDGVSLGEPSVFYNVRDERYKVPHLEYIYADKEEAIKAFQEKTIFDDGTIPEDLIVFSSLNENEVFEMVKDHCYVTHYAKSRYSINIYAVLKNKSNLEVNELRNVLTENLYELFNDNDFDLLKTYVSYNNAISYVVYCVKKALYLAEEVELYITIKKDGKCVHCVNYINGHLVKYESSSKLFEYNLNTYYDIKSGIKFDTNCALEVSEIVEKGVSAELKKINELRDINGKYKIKSNNSLLKLVRRIGNK